MEEEYKNVCYIKDKALSLVESQLNGDISSVNAKELGEVADIAKDMAELVKYCYEAKYFCKVIESMEDASEEDKSYYLNKYIPEYGGKFYTPIHSEGRHIGRYMYSKPYYEIYPESDYKHNDDYRHRMYYSSMKDDNDMTVHPSSTVHSNITRMTYMDMKDSDKNVKIEKLKEYIDDFSKEMQEMFIEGKASSEEKTIAKQALAQFINKL